MKRATNVNGNPIDYPALGRRIAKARKDAGVTQAKLSEQIDVVVQYISAIENGKRTPSLETVVRIAKALDTSVDELLYDTVPTPYAGYEAEAQQIMSSCNLAEKKLMVEMLRRMKPEIEAYERTIRGAESAKKSQRKR